MNNKIIEKVIKLNCDEESCPVMKYENPLLDRTIADVAAKSFVKMLKISQQNNKLRQSILQNILCLCQPQPKEHLQINENTTEILISFYLNHLTDNLNNIDSVDRELDAFLLRETKGLDINSKFTCTLNPEVIQALVNLSENIIYDDILMKEVIHFNNDENSTILKDLWTHDISRDSVDLINDVSIKIKSELERLLLEICHQMLETEVTDIEGIFSTKPLSDLLKKCSISPDCFQICSGILNHLFIKTNFDNKILNFVNLFAKSVQDLCSEPSYSILYPIRLSNIVMYFQIDLNSLPDNMKPEYQNRVCCYLKALNETDDLIMLLSHFPYWFDVYCQEIAATT